MLLKIKLPVLVEVSDYHEFNSIKYLLNDLSEQTVKVKELNTEKGIGKELSDEHNAIYLGVLYIGKMPSDNQLRKLKLTVICV